VRLFDLSFLWEVWLQLPRFQAPEPELLLSQLLAKYRKQWQMLCGIRYVQLEL
jgi:hypothetical protein